MLAARRPSLPGQLEGGCGTPVRPLEAARPDDPPLLRLYNTSDPPGVAPQRRVRTAARLEAVCPSVRDRGWRRGTRMSPCPSTGRLGEPVRLLVGVLSDPGNPARRHGIRQSWLRWSVGRAVATCFVLGRRLPGRAASDIAALDAEAAEFGDVLWLPSVSDGCSGRWMSLAKAHAFWRAAAALLPESDAPPRYVVKVDDDSFLHLPNLIADLRQLGCLTHVVYGRTAWCARGTR